ncbi:MAG: hypothetical protein LBD99_03830 [Candidatus Margulisbacteria bacterium]|nr:hypothetical protein [Candidatus Margulisiibacteriota bacterium]
MPDFIFINCPNCKTKIKIDRDKKYHDCEECKFEFRLDQVADIEPPTGRSRSRRDVSAFGAQNSLLEKLKKLQSSD